jgi:hypothetical protein
MKNFRPDVIIANLESLRLLAGGKGAESPLFSTAEITTSLAVLSNECRNAELPLSLILIQKIQSALASPGNPMTHGEFRELIHSLFHRFCDEFSAPPPRFLAITAEKTKLLQPGPPFGYEVSSAFPLASEDIFEATRCYALERNTAAVFHLMRAIEIGLDALRAHLRVASPDNPMWGNVIKALDSAVEKARLEGRIGKDAAGLYTDLLSDLRIIKNAWRNPTMHVKRSYDEELAFDILRATQRFLQDLAKTLKTPMAAKP